MLKPLRPGPALGVVMVASLVAGSAHAHGHARQASVSVPSHASLAVVESDQGFAIQARSSDGAPCGPTTSAATGETLTLGANLNLDRSIFQGGAHGRSEATNAHRR